jgi:hypothetical protein
MATSYDFWVKTQIDVETAAATAVTITTITKANPAQVSYASGTDPANGDTVSLDTAGMIELNGRDFRVANVNGAGNTFDLEGVDSTAYNTFTSGTFQVKTMGVSMTTVQDVGSSGGEYEFADLTTIHDDARRRAPTVSSPFALTLGCLFKPEDAAAIELGKANDTKTVRSIKVRWPSGRKALFRAYVGASGIPTGSAQEVVKTNVSFEGQGKPTFYAT